VGKFVVLILVAVAVWFVIKGLRKPPAPPRERRAAETLAGEAMVTCAHCGVHLPRSEAAAGGPRFYCSEDHRRLGES